MMSGLDIRYDLGDGHPLTGRRVPDLDLDAVDGPVRVYHPAARGQAGAAQPRGAGRVRLIDAVYGGTWELPVLGEVPAPAAVLIQPDGYVAWAGELAEAGLPEALSSWFGPG